MIQTWLKDNVKHGAWLRSATQAAERHGLGMLFSSPGMESLGDDRPFFHEDSAHHGIRVGFTPCPLNQFQGSAEKNFVIGRGYGDFQARVIRIPTGQWSEPRISGKMYASRKEDAKSSETTK